MSQAEHSRSLFLLLRLPFLWLSFGEINNVVSVMIYSKDFFFGDSP